MDWCKRSRPLLSPPVPGTIMKYWLFTWITAAGLTKQTDYIKKRPEQTLPAEEARVLQSTEGMPEDLFFLTLVWHRASSMDGCDVAAAPRPLTGRDLTDWLRRPPLSWHARPHQWRRWEKGEWRLAVGLSIFFFFLQFFNTYWFWMFVLVSFLIFCSVNTRGPAAPFHSVKSGL